MPYRSEKQRRFIFAKASEGVPWARKFIKDSGDTPPPQRDKAKHLRNALRSRKG